ncbi:MAG TPA: glycosyltransferase [Croceibacterium sp.]|nr:glycosyltransferase [Croceibacterium sp.]
MKRVLSLSTLYPNSAEPRFGTFVARSLEALAARGDWHVTLLNPIGLPPVSFGHYRALARAAVGGVERGVEVYRPTFRLIPRFGGRWNPSLIARAALPLARRFHAERPFDLVDAQFFWPDGPAAARIARALGLPLSIKARGADIHYWGAKPWARRAMLAAAREAKGLLAVSAALTDDMAMLGMERDKIAVHYTGLDRDLFRPLHNDGLRERVADEFGVALGGGPLFATIGALIPRKGQELTIRALADLPGGDLLLVGKGPDKARLRELADSLDLANRVHFLGPVDHRQLPAILSAADAMVLPSASEGLANAWVEALACGTPIVIADAGGAREVVTGPAAGRIVPRDPAAIAAALRALLADPPPRKKVAEYAARFDWNANAATLASHYERLTA